MKKINPLYVLALLLLTLFFVISSVLKIEKRISEASIQNIEIEKTGRQLKQLKQNWDDKAAAKAKIETLVSSKEFFGKVLDKAQNGDIYKISFANLADKEADALADKLFNSFFKIKTLSFEANGDQNISAVLELGL